jgi:hypothetical protein
LSDFGDTLKEPVDLIGAAENTPAGAEGTLREGKPPDD